MTIIIDGTCPISIVIVPNSIISTMAGGPWGAQREKEAKEAKAKAVGAPNGFMVTGNPTDAGNPTLPLFPKVMDVCSQGFMDVIWCYRLLIFFREMASLAIFMAVWNWLELPKRCMNAGKESLELPMEFPNHVSLDHADLGRDPMQT